MIKNKLLYALMISTSMTTVHAASAFDEDPSAVGENPGPIKRMRQDTLPMEFVGHEARVDEFLKSDALAWMEDRSFFEPESEPTEHNAGIKAKIAAENERFEAFRDKALETRIFDQLVSREEKSEDGYPHRSRGYTYYWRSVEGKPYPVHCRKKLGTDAEEIYMDENAMAEAGGHEYFEIGSIELSKDNRFMAYSLDTDGSEKYKILVKDLSTNSMIADTIEKVSSGIYWHATLPGFFYKELVNSVPKKLFFHRLGTTQAEDVLIYEEKNIPFSISVSLSGDESALLIESGDTATATLKIIDLRNDKMCLKEIAPESFGSRRLMATTMYGSLYFAVNEGDNVNYRILRAPLENAENPLMWETLIPSQPNCLLESFDVYDNHLVAVFMRNASHEAYIYPLGDFTKPQRIPFPDNPCGISIDYEEAGLPYVRFDYKSLLTPPTKFEFTFETGELKQVYKRPIPNYNPADYVNELTFSKTHDAKDLPISLLRRADSDPKKSPLFVYAYGSYGLSMDAEFRRSWLAIADAGFTLAIVHARGGSDCGFEWYLDGKMDKKMNTFFDVISGTEDLVKRFNITSPKDVVLNGGSAGGLVIGYCANARPDLFGTVIGEVPFVDLTKDMLNDTIPLTAGEWREWGNPRDPYYFDYFMRYDPMVNVGAHPYPDVLVTAGLTDPRVPYWEPLKFSENVWLQRTDKGLTFFYSYGSGGHFGGSGRYKPLEKVATKVAFARKAVDTWEERRK